MVCRHRPGDPACGSSPEGARRNAAQYIEDAERTYKRKMQELEALTPKADQFEILDVEPVGPHLAVKVKYPNCSACAWEGVKVLVIMNATLKDAIRWRKIDPHFRDPKATRSASEAPSPAARFPGSPAGWQDALEYAQRKAAGQGR